MRKWVKKALASILAVSMVFTGIDWIQGADKAEAADGSTTAKPDFEILTGEELTEDMGAGWNLGNTMDGHTGFTPAETEWQNVITTKNLIRSVHDMGFNTVRIPVTWGTMIDDENDYKINEAWISRVQDIVDYCISLDMYAIVNIHHDGAEQTGWLRIATEDQEGLEKKFAGVWKNIATTFKDYDEHLIFESMNEVKGEDMKTVEENRVIMKLNQIFVDTVRGTGSNNEQRWLMVPGKYNYIDSVCNTDNEFSLPTDTVENRLIVSVHIYTPNSFCLAEKNTDEKYTTYTTTRLEANDNEIKPLYDTYTSKGIPVVVGEYGCINKDNPTERAFYLEGMNRIFKKYKCVGVYWDNGYCDRTQKPDYGFAIIDRKTGEPIEKEVTDAILRGRFGLSGETDYSTLEHNPEIIPVTSMTASVTEAAIKVNETAEITMSYAPENSNDVILWKTADETVATVAYGKIHGKGVGSTIITAYTQNGSVSVDIPVTVEPEAVSNPCTDIIVERDSYDMTVKDSIWLNPQLTPANTEEIVGYRSSDEDVVTVSSVGKMVATGAGEAKVTIYTSGGKSKEVAVNVSATAKKTEIQLAVNVYYNDSDHDYFSNEVSQDILTTSNNGQYQLTFDCDRDLSNNAKEKGVFALSKLTAIYIKDYQVTNGTSSVSPLEKCNIHYDAITVDGVNLTLKEHEPKSALKDSGIFDTNDPINAWDGSMVDEIQLANSAVSFTTVTNPKKITITFTLSDMVFTGGIPGGTPAPVEPTVSPTVTPTLAPSPQATTPAGVTLTTDKPDGSTVKKGTTFQSGNGKYKVTNVSGKKVTYVAPKKKNAATVKIPNKVTYGGKSYTVTVVGAKAFKGNKKLKSVTIGANVKQIQTKAFYQCKNLKKITITSKKLTKVGNNAIGKIYSKAVIKVPKSKKKAYKKLFSKKTGYQKKMKIAV